MKHLLLLAAIFFTVNAFGQKKDAPVKTATGWEINVGDTLKLGMGTLPNGDFKFISNKGLGAGLTNQTPWTSGANKHNAAKNALSRDYSLGVAIVNNTKKGDVYIRIINKKGDAVGYYRVLASLAEKVGEIEKN